MRKTKKSEMLTIEKWEIDEIQWKDCNKTCWSVLKSHKTCLPSETDHAVVKISVGMLTRGFWRR